MTQDAICSLLSTAQEKADSLNSKLDPQLTQNYRELVIENWGLSIEELKTSRNFLWILIAFLWKWFISSKQNNNQR